MTDINKLAEIVESLALSVGKLTDRVANIRNQTEITEIAEPVARPKTLNLKEDHVFVVVNESDYAEDLSEMGRTLLSVRDSFTTLEDAREYAHLATERPLYIGEVSRSEDDPALKVRLKLRFASSL